MQNIVKRLRGPRDIVDRFYKSYSQFPFMVIVRFAETPTRLALITALLLTLANYKAYAQDVTGCLVQNDSQLYANFIGNRDPYWAQNPNPSMPAYNGPTYFVDNRAFVDVSCGSYYIVSRTSTSCLQYSNSNPPTFVSPGGNGVLATVRMKVCNLPVDTHIYLIAIFLGFYGFSALRNQPKSAFFKGEA